MNIRGSFSNRGQFQSAIHVQELYDTYFFEKS
jgi:hypothetical protein